MELKYLDGGLKLLYCRLNTSNMRNLPQLVSMNSYSSNMRHTVARVTSMAHEGTVPSFYVFYSFNFFLDL